MNAATISPGVRDVQVGAFLLMGSSNRPQMLPYWTETRRKSVAALQRRFQYAASQAEDERIILSRDYQTKHDGLIRKHRMLHARRRF
jgi:hypothetical protein